MTDAPWMIWARAQINTRETPGPANNPKIMGWAQKLGAKVLGISYQADSVAWCGLFAAAVVAQVGIKPPAIALRASQWALWGEEAEPCVGAVLVFQRPGGGHVGFYEGHDDTTYSVLGGNQSDKVCVTRIEKSRCIAVRWPHGYAKTKPHIVTGSGALSRNEA